MIRNRPPQNAKRWNGKLERSNGGDCYTIAGRHIEKGFELYFFTTNCAPEQFAAYINGKKVRIASPSEYGILLLSNDGPQVLIDKLKRLYRKENKDSSGLISYGFSFRDDPTSGVYANFTGKKNDIHSRLLAYKNTRKYFASIGWKYLQSRTAHLGAGYKVEHVKDDYKEIDPNRPFTVNIFRKNLFFEQ